MKLRTFSPSTWNTFRDCKLKIKFQKIDKLCVRCFKGTMSKALNRTTALCSNCLEPEPEVPQLVRGSLIDKQITNFILTGTNMPLLANIDAQTAMQKLRALRIENAQMILPQFKMTFTRDLKPVRDADFSIVTGILDVLIFHLAGHAQDLDWKTGSVKPNGLLYPDAKDKYADQLEIYAMMLMLWFEGLNEVDSSIYFVDATNGGREDLPSFTRDDLPGLLRRWTSKIELVLEETEFKKKAGRYCSWCPYNKTKNHEAPCDPKAP